MENKFFVLVTEEYDHFKDTSRDVVKELATWLRDIKEVKDTKIYYSGQNIGNFNEKVRAAQADGFVHLSNPDSIRHVCGRTAISIDDSPKRENKFCYIQYCLSLFSIEYCTDILAELTEQSLQYPDGANFYLINFCDALAGIGRGHIFTFRDAANELPTNILATQVITKHEELLYILHEINTQEGFSLRDTSRFKDTGKRYTPSGQKIYEDNKTGYLWYLDKFHKDKKITYEVFDKTGKKYVGEHDENGKPTGKTDDSRRIDQYL